MPSPRWPTVAWCAYMGCYLGCLAAWVQAALTGQDVEGHFVQGLIMGTFLSVLNPWLTRRLSDDPTTARDHLAPAHRDIVDQAIAAGELRGPVTLRTVERDLARHRLYQHPDPRRRATFAAISAVLPYLGLALAGTRPGWLVAATIATTLAGAALITPTLRRGDDLDPDERRRLQALARSRP